MEHESATCTCPNCKHRFRVLADEYGDHECPRCGLRPGREAEDDERKEP